MSRQEIVAQQVMFVLDKLRETNANIVLATYTKEEFQELRPGEDYDSFKAEERMFIEMLADHGVQDRVVFQYIDSVGYYRGRICKAVFKRYRYARKAPAHGIGFAADSETVSLFR